MVYLHTLVLLHVLLILFMNIFGPHNIETTRANVAIIIFTLSVCFTLYYSLFDHFSSHRGKLEMWA